MKYRFVIEDPAFQTVWESVPRVRRTLHGIFIRMAEDSFHEPDMKDVIRGRKVLLRFFGPFSVTYVLDHAVKEVRIPVIFRD